MPSRLLSLRSRCLRDAVVRAGRASPSGIVPSPGGPLPPAVCAQAVAGRVGGDDGAGGGHPAVDQPQLPQGAVVTKEALAAAHHHRVDDQPQLVHQAVLHQRLRQPGASDHHQVTTLLPLEGGDGPGDVAAEERGVPPRQRLGERGGRHVLGPRVQRLREGLLLRGRTGPVRGEVLVRAAPEQVGARPGDGLQQPALERLVARVAHVPAAVRKAAVGVLAGADGRLRHAVQRHELAHDHLAHLVSSQERVGPHRPPPEARGAAFIGASGRSRSRRGVLYIIQIDIDILRSGAAARVAVARRGGWM